MYEALAQSMNAPAVWLLNQIGVNRGYESVKDFNIPVTKKDKNLALALGSLPEVSRHNKWPAPIPHLPTAERSSNRFTFERLLILLAKLSSTIRPSRKAGRLCRLQLPNK